MGTARDPLYLLVSMLGQLGADCACGEAVVSNIIAWWASGEGGSGVSISASEVWDIPTLRGDNVVMKWAKEEGEEPVREVIKSGLDCY